MRLLKPDNLIDHSAGHQPEITGIGWDPDVGDLVDYFVASF
jgi:hypothetical protein